MINIIYINNTLTILFNKQVSIYFLKKLNLDSWWTVWNKLALNIHTKNKSFPCKATTSELNHIVLMEQVFIFFHLKKKSSNFKSNKKVTSTEAQSKNKRFLLNPPLILIYHSIFNSNNTNSTIYLLLTFTCSCKSSKSHLVNTYFFPIITAVCKLLGDGASPWTTGFDHNIFSESNKKPCKEINNHEHCKEILKLQKVLE